jgi:hypothetical protein
MSEKVVLGDWKPKERRYIVEWAESKYPGFKKRFNVPIGPVPQSIIEELGFERGVRMYRRWRPYCDCLVYLPDKLILAEAEIINPKNAIGDLLYYRAILPDTPDIPEIKTMPVEYTLVIPAELKWVEEICQKEGIKIDIFTPDWIKEYLEQWWKYTSKEQITLRELRKRLVGRL